MTYQAYLDTIQAKTGKTPDDFRALAAKIGLAQYGEIMAWPKADYGLGHGHANVIAHLIVHHDEPKVTTDDRVARQFAGNKERWRKPYDALLAKLDKFGTDMKAAPTDTYISLLRGGKKFGLVQITAERMDIGIKLKGVAPTDRFEAAGKWNAMVTHRVRITEPKQIDKDVIAWLKQAYAAAI
jgi:Domain of unknown function (DUF5655)/Domain of unknown function (DUF4287)